MRHWKERNNGEQKSRDVLFVEPYRNRVAKQSQEKNPFKSVYYAILPTPKVASIYFLTCPFCASPPPPRPFISSLHLSLCSNV